MSWTQDKTEPGYKTKTLKRGSCTITIRRPVLDHSEAAKREEKVKRELAQSMTEYQQRRKNNEQNHD